MRETDTELRASRGSLIWQSVGAAATDGGRAQSRVIDDGGDGSGGGGVGAGGGSEVVALQSGGVRPGPRRRLSYDDLEVHAPEPQTSAPARAAAHTRVRRTRVRRTHTRRREPLQPPPPAREAWLLG